MKRSAPLTRRMYAKVAKRARAIERHLVCRQCSRSLIDGKERHDDRRPRSLGSDTILANLNVLCNACHQVLHHIPVTEAQA